MVGLSASELQAETLFPGDTVEYYSMVFVAGDPRGHRLSKVLRIDRKDDEFPIEVDTQEMLPLTIMLKRKRDRNDVEISSDDAKWRKLRTFKLVDGEVEGETRADRLNAGLKKSLVDAMKSTKKQLVMEKEKKANAGSKKLMDMFLTKSAPAFDEGETTSSQCSSLEELSTPERKKKKKREPLTPRDNTYHYSSERSPEKLVSKQNRGGSEKTVVKRRREDEITKPERKFKYDPPYKHESRKRKRSDFTSTKPKQIKTLPRKKSASAFFGSHAERHRSKKKNGLLEKFIERIDEIEEKKRKAGIDEYMELDAEEKEAVAEMEAECGASDTHATSNGGPGGSDNPGKTAWIQQWSRYREKNAGPSTMRSWLKPLDKRGGNLEEASGGTPTKPHQSKQRTLNLAPDKTKSPKKNRRNDLNFVMSDNPKNPHQSKEMKSSKHHKSPPSNRESFPRKKRGSLGTVSARAPKTPGNWIHRKASR